MLNKTVCSLKNVLVCFVPFVFVFVSDWLKYDREAHNLQVSHFPVPCRWSVWLALNFIECTTSIGERCHFDQLAKVHVSPARSIYRTMTMCIISSPKYKMEKFVSHFGSMPRGNNWSKMKDSLSFFPSKFIDFENFLSILNFLFFSNRRTKPVDHVSVIHLKISPLVSSTLIDVI